GSKFAGLLQKRSTDLREVIQIRNRLEPDGELVEVFCVTLIVLADSGGSIGQNDQKLFDLRSLGFVMSGSLVTPALQLLGDVPVEFLHQGSREIAGKTAFERLEVLLQIVPDGRAHLSSALSHGAERRAIGFQQRRQQ